MYPIKLLPYLGVFIFLMACGGTSDASKLFDIQLEGQKKQYQKGQSVNVAIRNKQKLPIDKIVYSVDGKELKVDNGKINFDIEKLGSKTLKATIAYDDQTVEISRDFKLLANKAPEIYTYTILNTYPHDAKAYTQGLEFSGDTLYESTGQRGNSSLRKVDFKTGEILTKIDLNKAIFGEGITLLNNKVYQLSWQSGVGYIYDQGTLEKLENFRYGNSKEGWGLCNDGQTIYKSDGTEKIWLLDPNNLTETGFIETVTNKSIFNRANELEYVNGKIYANVYGKESMMIIDAKSGAIEGVINFGGLKKLVTKGANWDDQNSVLNGVAYHSERKTFFVTGKNWNKLFEVEIMKK
ncbi:MAG: glutaminyl-peptide cyclotransferase [Croceitalea sp.]|nr:glutaminyl-peptide cyclotransferase [Croceitalea sp.]